MRTALMDKVAKFLRLIVLNTYTAGSDFIKLGYSGAKKNRDTEVAASCNSRMR
jgi:hypothetical protein